MKRNRNNEGKKSVFIAMCLILAPVMWMAICWADGLPNECYQVGLFASPVIGLICGFVGSEALF